jgi:ribosomal RNA-processing protein 8
MFAVPGWAVSPASLVQEKRSAKSESSRPSSGDHPTDGPKKRKSTHAQHDDQSSKKISGRELERLWNQRSGSGKASRANNGDIQQQKKKKKKKPGRRDADADAVTTASKQQNTSEVTVKESDDAAQRSSLKTKKQSTKDDKKKQKEEPKRNRQSKQDGSNEEDFERSSSAATASRKATIEAQPSALSRPTPSMATKLTPLQAKMRSKLTSARFRHLNETLYTTSSSSAMDLFTTSPDLFAEYHAGFSQQVKDSWPQNPVDQYVRTIKSRGQPSPATTTTMLPLPRRKTGSCTIADLGCGDAPLARGCQSQIKNLQLKFHNFDLHAPNSHVTKADISNLPLRDGEADIVIFCLSLMGTNWPAFVEEAWRVLRGDGRGEVWVAEVKSRFGRVTRPKGPGHVVENSVGKRRKVPKSEDQATGEELFVEDSEAAAADATDISAFVKVFARRGFVLREDSVDKSNKMFVTMVFVKSGVPTAGKHKGLKWTGREYQKVPDGKMKFVNSGQAGKDANNDDDIPAEEEAKALKPCVYKTR